jgi:hypothetical protein
MGSRILPLNVVDGEHLRAAWFGEVRID